METAALRQSPGHPFYEKLNEIFRAHGFDAFVENPCAQCYHKKMGRPSIAPGVYFRMLLIGYFEGIDSERGIAWHVADSLGLRRFLGCDLNDSTPDHSSVSRTRRMMEIETPTRADLTKLDKKRPKKGSNKNREHPHDPDAKIGKMKDGRTLF